MGPAGSDQNPGTEQQPFRTLDKAYTAASPGDVVEVEGGTYLGYQALDHDPAKDSRTDRVTFVADAPVHFDAQGDVSQRLDVFGDHVAFEGAFQFDYVRVTPRLWASNDGADDIEFKGTWIHVLQDLGRTHGLYLYNNQLGPNNIFGYTGGAKTSATGSDDILDFYWGGTPFWDPDQVNTDIEVVGNHFDGAYHSWDGSHSDCIQFTLASNVLIARNTFSHCYDETIMAKNDQGALARITIENNFLGRPVSQTDPYTIQASPCQDCTIRFNSTPPDAYLIFKVQSASTATAESIYGNLTRVDATQCSATQGDGWKWDGNLFISPSETCGANAATVATPMYVNAAAGDLRLQPGSSAVGAYRGSAPAPLEDIDGTARPQDHPDVGAYEMPGG